MKGSTGKKSFWRRAANLALPMIVLGSILFVGAAPTSAAGDGAPPQQEGRGERSAIRLELAYQRLLLAADMQAVYLDHSPDVTGRVQEWINTLAEKGEDVSHLQAALDAFKDAITESQGHYKEAMAILDPHAGFDNNGKVTDREQAVATIREAGQALRETRRTLKDGAIELRRAIRDWHREHRPRPDEAGEAAPG